MTDLRAAFEAMAPLLRRYRKTDGSYDFSTFDFEPMTTKLHSLNSLPAEQLKEKMLARLSGEGLQVFLNGLNPDHLTQEKLSAYADRYNCTVDEMVAALKAAHDMTRDRMSDFAQRMEEASPEEIKAKLDAMAGKAETLRGGSSE